RGARKDDERELVIEDASALTQDDRAEPPHILALEVAANRREGKRLRPGRAGTVGRRFARERDFRPDAVGERPEDLCDAQRLGALIDRILLVGQPRQNVRPEAAAQDDLLDREDLLVDGVIDAVAGEERLVAPVVPAFAGELAQERRREPERPVAE